MAIAVAMLGATAGCSSDATAPQDPIPPVSAGDAASQAGLVAYGVAQFGTKLMDPSAPAKAVQTIPWNGQMGLEGTVYIDYRTGADGAPAASNVATWAHLYTEDGAPVVYTMPDLGGQTSFALDVQADLDQQADQATILEGSGGTMVSGDYTVDLHHGRHRRGQHRLPPAGRPDHLQRRPHRRHHLQRRPHGDDDRRPQ